VLAWTATWIKGPVAGSPGSAGVRPAIRSRIAASEPEPGHAVGQGGVVEAAVPDRLGLALAHLAGVEGGHGAVDGHPQLPGGLLGRLGQDRLLDGESVDAVDRNGALAHQAGFGQGDLAVGERVVGRGESLEQVQAEHQPVLGGAPRQGQDGGDLVGGELVQPGPDRGHRPLPGRDFRGAAGRELGHHGELAGVDPGPGGLPLLDLVQELVIGEISGLDGVQRGDPRDSRDQVATELEHTYDYSQDG
jgi:hypothetical protein